MKYKVGDVINNIYIKENIGRINRYNRNLIHFKCICFCNKEFIISANNFKRTISCGCHKEKNFLNKTKCKSGDVFGKLTVLQDVKINKTRYVNCKCECGNEKIIKAGYLISGIITNCGCIKKKIVSKFENKYNINDKFGKLTIKHIDIIKSTVICLFLCDCGNYRKLSMRCLSEQNITQCKVCEKKEYYSKAESWKPEYNKYFKENQKTRKLEWSLTLEEFVSLVRQNCYYCDQEPGTDTSSIFIKRNGIDRINNDIGYHYYNCISCCPSCNVSKSDKKLEKFLSWAIRISNNAEKIKKLLKNDC